MPRKDPAQPLTGDMSRAATTSASSTRCAYSAGARRERTRRQRTKTALIAKLCRICATEHDHPAEQRTTLGMTEQAPLQDDLIRALQLVVANASPTVRDGGIVPPRTGGPFAAGSNSGSTRRIAGQLGGLVGANVRRQ
jgi:hypothetical protein